MSEAEIGIGALAERAGVRISTIRYYERRGLLPEPERIGGRRSYPPEIARRLDLIAIAKRAGFSLEEIRLLLDADDRGETVGAALRVLAAGRLAEVEALIRRAEESQDWLRAASECSCRSLESCALFAAGA